MHVLNRTEGFRDLAVTPGVAGREPCQVYWHPWIVAFVNGLSVLDVGSGVSSFKVDALAAGAASVVTQDPCEWCGADLKVDVETLAEEGVSWDVVVSTDVIEHIVNYGRFVRALVRIAKQRIIITTPGVGVTQNQNVNHYHEFYPDEVVQLFAAAGARLERFRFEKEGVWFEYEGEEALKAAVRESGAHPLGFIFHV